MKKLFKIIRRFSVDVIMLVLVTFASVKFISGDKDWSGMIFIMILYVLANIIMKNRTVNIMTDIEKYKKWREENNLPKI